MHAVLLSNENKTMQKIIHYRLIPGNFSPDSNESYKKMQIKQQSHCYFDFVSPSFVYFWNKKDYLTKSVN